MRYMILIYNDMEARADMTPEDGQMEFEAYMDFNKTAAEQGVLRDAIQLHDASTATTIRIRDGKSSTFDGPFAETKEVLGGIYILECENLDEAIKLAALIPAAKSGSVEIRPIMEIPG